MPFGSDTSTAEPGATAYRVRLPAFEGPLDLLLHLIRINEIDITDIPIVEIAQQYNAALDLMRELNLEVAGEFLVMASTLLHIKSRMLLPPDPSQTPENAEDPRSELARQLQEYERYRRAALHLTEAEREASRSWLRPASRVAEFEGEAALEADLFLLLTAFRRMMDLAAKEETTFIQRDRVSLLDRIQWLLERLRENGRLAFSDLFVPGSPRSDLIVTFLALLELIRLRVVGAVQTAKFGEIEILVLETPGPVALDSGRILDA